MLFKILSAWFIIQGIIQKWPGYYSTYGSLFMVLFKIRSTVSGSGFGILFKIRPAASGSLFRVLFKIRPAAFGSGFSVLFKNIHGIIQRLVHYSGY